MHCFISRMWSLFCHPRPTKSQILQLSIWLVHLQEARESTGLCPFLLRPHFPHVSDVGFLCAPSDKSLPAAVRFPSCSPRSPEQLSFLSLNPNLPFYSLPLRLYLLTQSNKEEQIWDLTTIRMPLIGEHGHKMSLHCAKEGRATK